MTEANKLVEALSGPDVKTALFKLANFAARTDGKVAAVAADAANTIVKVMRTHAADPTIAENACWALGNIASLDTGSQACAAAGAQIAIIYVMYIHGHHEGVAHHGCVALGLIAPTDVISARRAVAAAMEIQPEATRVSGPRADRLLREMNVYGE